MKKHCKTKHIAEIEFGGANFPRIRNNDSTLNNDFFSEETANKVELGHLQKSNENTMIPNDSREKNSNGEGADSGDLDPSELALQMHLKFLSKINMANKTAVEIYNDCRSFVKDALSYIEENMKKLGTTDTALESFQVSSYSVTRSMDLLDTEHKVLSAAKNANILFEPRKFIIKQNRVQYGGEFDIDEEYGTIMPVKEIIKKFLELPDVLEKILENQIKSSLGTKYRNIINGNVWKNIKCLYSGKNCIPIALYCDEFLTDSPVGPHAKDTKLNAFYFSFPTLPDFVATNLSNIFVALLHCSKDVDQNEVAIHGVDPALFALLEVLIPLEKEGIMLNINGIEKRVYIVVPQFFGDNLALNTVFGFNRGFKSSYPCRVCIVSLKDMEKNTEINEEELRTEANYYQCLQGDSVHSRKGLHFESLLNRLVTFKVYFNISVDIMHDIMLGILKYDLIQILKYYIYTQKYFTLEEFNHIKEVFDYGSKCRGDKTVPIIPNHLKDDHPKIHANAKEMWTLMENLPLILFQILPSYRTCPVFKFVVLISKLIDQVTRREYSEEDINELEQTIIKHHQLYLTLFNTENYRTHLTFKFHIMLHYPLYIRQFGPLRNAMTFKFEMKHQHLKKYANQCYSRKNVSYSICKKLCIELAYNISKKPYIFSELQELSFSNSIQFASTTSNLQFCSSVNFKGFIYEISDIVRTKDNVFEIKGIGVDINRQKSILYCQQLNVRFNTEVNFFEVENHSDLFCELEISELLSRPVNIHRVQNKNFVFFRN